MQSCGLRHKLRISEPFTRVTLFVRHLAFSVYEMVTAPELTSRINHPRQARFANKHVSGMCKQLSDIEHASYIRSSRYGLLLPIALIT